MTATHARYTRYLERLFLLVVTTLVSLAAIALIRTALYTSARPVVPAAPAVAIPVGAAERLARSLRFATISRGDAAAFDGQPFLALHAHLEESFPRVHAQLVRERVNQYSLLYTWPGSEPRLEAMLLMGHLDVVPVEPGTEAAWDEPPFAGRVVDGHVWGRGAIDNKSAVLGTLEAVELLLAEGFRPARTIYLAYGHDEEVGGREGAQRIAALLQARGVRLAMVLDEGGIIGDGVLPGLSTPVALVGVAEKGFISVELTARAAGGHSSLPPAQTAIGILSAAVARVESQPMPARLDGATRQLFDRIGPELSFGRRLAFANLWLAGGLVTSALEESATTNAMIRTTTAATIIEGGTKDNVLPSEARAVINARILPGDTTASVTEHLRDVIGDGRVALADGGRFSAEPSAVSSSEASAFRALSNAILGVHRDVLVAPYLVVVATDARYFSPLSDNVYRFLPVRLTRDDLARMHGTNERLAVRDYEQAIRTYRQIIIELDRM